MFGLYEPEPAPATQVNLAAPPPEQMIVEGAAAPPPNEVYQIMSGKKEILLISQYAHCPLRLPYNHFPLILFSARMMKPSIYVLMGSSKCSTQNV